MVLGLMLPVKTMFLGGGAEKYFDNPLLYAWANFDGVHYWSIAYVGYRQFEQAFFPLYPLLINLISGFVGINSVLVGIIISNACIFVAIIFLYKLVKIDFKEKIAFWTIIFLLVVPTSFYFGSVYTESLFFVLSVASFYFARKQNWFLAGICGMFASATRIVGILLFPALILEYWLSYKHNKKNLLYKIKWLSLALIPCGLLVYMYWLNKNYQDPFYFFHAQSAFGAGRSGGSFILFPQVVFRYVKILTTLSFGYQYVISSIELILSLSSFVLIFLGRNKLRISYILYAFLLLVTPTLTGTFLSMPRFIVTVFPLFILLAIIIKNDNFKKIIAVGMALLLIIATMFYTRGYWIA